MLKYLCLFVVVLVVASSAATQAVPKPADIKPDYSKEAFVDEEDLTKIVFENDGTSTREASFRLRIQSDAGVQRYSVLSFAYQEATETVEIVYVRVIKPDGTVIVTPAENILDMPSDITRQAPFYSDLHEKHAAVKGLTVGDILETQTRWHVTKPLAPAQFWLAFNFPHDLIMLHQEVHVSVPGDRAVKWKSPASKPVITEEGGRRVFTWTRSQLEHKSADQDKTKQEEQAYQAARGKLPPPDIQLSSFQSWEEIGAWYGGLQQERVKPSPEIRAKAAELTKNATDDSAKLHAIYDYVSTQFRYIGVAFGIGRYQPHSAADVLANQYGDCKDKHTLLASLLNAAGIKAYPALINISREIDLDVPSPAQFDHVITAVPQPKDFLWLDTTAEVAPFGYLISALLNKQVLVVPTDQHPRFVTTPGEELPKPLRTFTIEAQLDDAGTLEGKVEQSLQGDDAEVLLRKGFRSTPSQQWKDLVQRFSYGSGFSGDVSDVSASQPEKTDEPWHVSYTYQRKDYPEWTNHRISPPLPPITLPSYRDDETKPTVPVWLGPISEIDLRSQVELPKGYRPVLPSAVNLKEDFAEYHATYGVKDGKLTTERHLITKHPEILVSEYEQYRKFRKAIEDDHNAYVETSTGGASSQPMGLAAAMAKIRSLPNSANESAMAAEKHAMEAGQRGDLSGAIASFKQAVELDSKFTRDWLMLGTLQMNAFQSDAALENLHKAVDSDPMQVLPLRILGYALIKLKKYDEAVIVLQRIIKIAPEDAEAPWNLGTALREMKRYPEAAAAYESALKLNPDKPRLAMELGEAYLHAGDELKALAAYKKTLELSTEPVMFNDVAYELAEANKQLRSALEYAERAVREEEEASAKVKLSDLKMEDLGHTSSLGAYWDTLGWVYFRVGNYEKAEKYLKAGWMLSRDPAEGDHLGQLYERQHKDDLAMRMYRLALGASKTPDDMKNTQEHLDRLGGTTESGRFGENVTAELSETRTFAVERITKETSDADFFLLIGPGSKVEEVKFVSGSEELKSADKALRAIEFKMLFPDDGPSRLVRRGILSCYPVTGCNFVLYNLSDVHSVN
jgi:tetratricopeptide (TPR) repeat protein/transglutaminase-like putative cysteine protease